MADRPVKLTAQQLDRWQVVGGTQASGFSGGIFPSIKAGQQWPGLKDEGPRFVLDANNLTILYLQNGTVYAQNTTGFVEDYRTYPAVRGAQGAKAMATISVFVVDALMGIASAAGGPAATAVMGKDIIQFVNRHGTKVIMAGRVFIALAKARAVLMTYAPNLYNKAVEAVFRKSMGASWFVLKKSFPVLVKVGVQISPNIPSAIDQNFHKSGKATGKLIGKMGVSAMRGKLGFAGGFIKVLLFVAMQVLKSLPKAASVKATEYKDLALQLETSLRMSGVNLRASERDEIFDEIKKNPRKIVNCIKTLNEALQKL